MKYWHLTETDLTAYRQATNAEYAYSLLLLIGPDLFDGDYDEMMAELEAAMDCGETI